MAPYSRYHPAFANRLDKHALFSLHFTSTTDDSSHEEGQVTVIQPQGVEACGKLEFGLHHVTQGAPETFEELAGDKTPTTCHQHTVFVHAGGQEREQSFVDAILQQSHLV